MEKHIIDEKTGIPYTLIGDYYLPWGDLPDDEPEQRPIGIWGQRHLRYIKRYRRVLYTDMLTSGKLNYYLADLNEEAEEMYSRLLIQMKKVEHIDERLKANDQMEWVRRSNSIRNRAAEVVNNEIIFN